MKLREVIQHLQEPDGEVDDNILDMEVLFDTSDRFNLELFSVYVHEGTLRVDIGDVEED